MAAVRAALSPPQINSSAFLLLRHYPSPAISISQLLVNRMKYSLPIMPLKMTDDTRVQINFTPLSSSVSSYKGSSDDFNDANIQLALAVIRKLQEKKETRARAVFADKPEKRRASEFFKAALDLNGDARNSIWKLTEISESSQCQSLKLPETLRVTKISKLIYMNSGNAILALASNGINLLWKWQINERNPSGKATTSFLPQFWTPSSGIIMTNDAHAPNQEEAVSCLDLSRNDCYLMSACGGKISLFNMLTFRSITTFMPPPPAGTFLAFHPQDNNIIAIGMDDSSILIYNVRVGEVKSKLEGHSKRITGLAFSHVLNVLVSSGADSQLCVWSTDGWEKQRTRSLQLPGRSTSQSDTRVQFHRDQTHFLVVHEAQIAIYETTKLECLNRWVPRESAAPIAHATFSCDSQLIYASFLDATVYVFTARHLHIRCRIVPSAYLSPSISNSNIHPVVVAAHPQDPNQFALGLSDGSVRVFEPLESEGKWGVPPPLENGFAKGMPAAPSVGASGFDQAPR